MFARNTKVLLLFCFFLFLGVSAKAQASKEGKKHYNSYKELLALCEDTSLYYDTTISLGLKILQAELNVKDKKPDTLFWAVLFNDIGGLFEKQFSYKLAAQYYGLAGSAYQKLNKPLFAGKAISRYLRNYYEYQEWKEIGIDWEEGDSTFFSHGKGDTSLWLTTDAYSVKKNKTGDTIFVGLSIGKASGVKPNSKFDVFTTHSPLHDKARKSTFAGTGFITEISDFTSSGFIALIEDFTDSIYVEDAFEVKILADKEYATGEFSQLGLYNIRLRDYANEVYYTVGDGNATIRGSRYDLPLKLAILDDLKEAVKYYNGEDSSIMAGMVPHGRYAGYTYGEFLASASVFDLEMFLDFVISFPGKYINHSWSFPEVFATWAINDCPLGNAEMRVIDSLLSFPKSRLMGKDSSWMHYYQEVSYPDSIFHAKVWELYEFEPEKRFAQFEKMKSAAHLMGMKSSDSFFTMQLIYASSAKEKAKQGLKYAEEIWPGLKGRHKMYVALYQGIFYSALDQNESMISALDTALAIDTNYYYARGYKGWGLVKLGKARAAYNDCLFAFQWDSFSSWTYVNLAHSLYLRGQKAEAHRLYKKSFEYMETESNYYTGLEADFDYFIHLGRNEEEFKEVKKFYSDYFLKNWKYVLIGDSIKARAEKFRNNKNYEAAAPLYKAAIEAYSKSGNVSWEKVRMANRLLGFVYYKSQKYKESFVYYQKAAEITKSKELGDDYLVTDYTDMSNLYELMGDTIRELEYQARASAVDIALREKRERKNLYMLVIGGPGTNNNDIYATADATELGANLKTAADLHFDAVANATLTGKKATIANVKNALDSAIYTLSENDVFIFYFSGLALHSDKDVIQLADGTLNLKELYGYLGQIQAGRQIHIADCNGLNWREWYQSSNFGLLSDEKRSLVFMGTKTARIEESELKHSVMSAALIEGLKRSTADGSATATEWLSAASKVLLEKDQLYAVEMQSFGHDFTIGEEKIKLLARDSAKPIIELYGAKAVRGENISLVSGSTVKSGKITDDSRIIAATANGVPLLLGANGRFDLPQELLTEKRIRIYAKDEFGNEDYRDYEIQDAENASTSEGTKYAFLFASSDYKYWDDLANPIFDANSIADILRNNYGYTVTVLEDPTNKQIKEKLVYISKLNFRPSDQLLVFFAGHGLYDSSWGGLYVCPESPKPENDLFYESYIKHQDIAFVLNGCRANNVFLIMDVCFGGKMFDKNERHEIRTVNDGNEMTPEQYIKMQLAIRCRQFLTSGGDNYVADGIPGAHSPFASRVITALENAATNQDYITASQMMDYLRTVRTVGNDKKSAPRYGSFGDTSDRGGEYVLEVTRKIQESAIIAALK